MAEDDQQPQEAVNTAERAPSQDNSPQSETSAPVQQEATQPEEQSSQAGDQAEHENKPSRRLSERLSQLYEKGRAEGMQQQPVPDFFSQTQAQQDAWGQYEAGEITMDQLKGLVQQESLQSAQYAAQTEVQKLRQEMETQAFWNDLQQQSNQIQAKIPALNPESTEFDKEYFDTVTKTYQELIQTAGRNAPPLNKYVENFERVRSKAAKTGQALSSATLADQAAQASVAPETGSRPRSQGTAKDQMIERGKQSGDFKDLFKAMARGEA